uniref:Retrotransposon Copia-like N-terminal domain-containing protein n=1 Tax=Populus davidiana TaxID=266767 RepID=A0A6M2F232_9ROSI
MASSFSIQIVSPAALKISLPKTHLPDIFIKLASNNYLLWKAQVIYILRAYGLLGYVKNMVPCPVSIIIGENSVLQTNLEAAVWLCIDQLIFGWINSFLSDGPLSPTISNKYSHDA